MCLMTRFGLLLRPLMEQANSPTIYAHYLANCTGKTDLSYLKFAVVGLGNSDYDTFCFAVDEVEKTLLKQGAQQVCPSLRIDVLTEFDHDQCAEEWLPNFTSQL